MIKDTEPKLNIKQLIKDNLVFFKYFRQDFFFYAVHQFQGKDEHDDWFDYSDEDGRYNTWIFPVPLEDIGTATMLDRDKAITFMRWIRKAIEDKTLIKL